MQVPTGEITGVESVASDQSNSITKNGSCGLQSHQPEASSEQRVPDRITTGETGTICQRHCRFCLKSRLIRGTNVNDAFFWVRSVDIHKVRGYRRDHRHDELQPRTNWLVEAWYDIRRNHTAISGSGFQSSNFSNSARQFKLVTSTTSTINTRTFETQEFSELVHGADTPLT
jgi:hypothetical protein